MARRLHTPRLQPGLLTLDETQAHHAQHVLRLSNGDEVEVFDDEGRAAPGRVVLDSTGGFRIDVAAFDDRPVAPDRCIWTVAAAVPKGDRVDWMVEKLSELGCHAYIPLLCERSVVQPKGQSKIDRWVRIATESAKQCRRAGVMRIEQPIAMPKALAAMTENGVTAAGWFLDTGPTSLPVRELLLRPDPPERLQLFIGPEGGWTEQEVDRMQDARLTGVGLTRTILRVETAAVAVAALVGSMWGGPRL